MRKLILLAFVVVGFAGAAKAGEHSEIISTKGYDLSTRSGATAFYHRLKQAAAEVCRMSTYSYAPEGQLLQHDECYDDALNTAVAQAASPTLTAIHEGASPTRLASRTR
jgi:UrcA family protein